MPSSRRSLTDCPRSVWPGTSRNSSINWIFLWRLLIQNHLKPSITERWRIKAKYLKWDSISLKSVKKTNMLNPVENLGNIKCYSSNSPKPAKSSSNNIRYNCQKIHSWQRRRKTILEIRKKLHFSRWLTILLFTIF